ncbi:DUF2182 domain-containing protein, partial [Kocuria rosea]|uniref:copper chaperone n=1 Tax=Kocuria rosea TaxID=1275 RepID=UPI00203F2471|nr:DUF2182 domain-containing protein [Kocuria rosea]
MDQQLLVLGVLVAAAGAWVLLFTLHGGTGHTLVGPSAPSTPLTDAVPGDHLAHGHGSPATVPSALISAILALSGWVLMVIAMMLPPALPLLQTVRRLVSRRPDPWRLTVVSAMTFVGAWTLVGVVLVGGNSAVQALAAQRASDCAHP